MIGWTLYLIGIAIAFYVGWVLRGWREEDRANQAAFEKAQKERWTEKARGFAKVPKDRP